MVSKLVQRGVLAAVAGAAFVVAAASAPASAFTLSAPSLAAPVASAGVQHVWWDRWGRWHPNHPWGWRRWGWGPGPYAYGYYGPVRHCWRGPWGGLHCRWG
jgi:hypothetical protein